MKKCYLLVTTLLFAIGSSAQDRGEDYFAVGELDKARAIFGSRISGDPAETNYYLGEIARAQGDSISARSYYEKGLAADPENAFCQVGLAVTELKKNPAEGDRMLTALAKAKKNRKDPELLTAIARAYYDNDMTARGDARLEAAEAAGDKSAAPDILRGERLEPTDPGAAAGKYEQALMKDPDNVPAYIRIARIYMHSNPAAVIERLRELEARDSGNPLVLQYLARACFTAGQYADAIALYERLYDPAAPDIDVVTYYAASLFFTDRYDRASQLTQQGLALDPDNFVLTRLCMYSELSRKDYKAGLEIADKFFRMPVGENEYIARDYLTYGELLTSNDRIDEAVVQFDKALAVPETPANAIRQIADNLNKKHPEAAAKYFRKYIDALGENAQASDYYTLGQSYYKAAALLSRDTVSTDAPVRLAQCLDSADEAFAVVSERIPESHLGPLFRARVNSLRDPEATAGLAKPYYEKVAEIVLGKENPAKERRELVESYRYLSYYYYVKYDAEKQTADRDAALGYCAKILELDPDNDVAHQLQDALKE